jgi:hypothetical protein
MVPAIPQERAIRDLLTNQQHSFTLRTKAQKTHFGEHIDFPSHVANVLGDVPIGKESKAQLAKRMPARNLTVGTYCHFD